MAFAVKNGHMFWEECSFKERDNQFSILDRGPPCG